MQTTRKSTPLSLPARTALAVLSLALLAPAAHATTTVEGRVTSISSDRSDIAVAQQDKPAQHFTLTKPMQEIVTKTNVDDVLVLTLDNNNQLQAVSTTATVNMTQVFIALAMSLLALLAVTVIFLGKSFPNLLINEDNRYSNSKFQMTVWFAVLVTTYLGAVVLRYPHGLIGGIDIPQHLLLLSGMSALTFGAAKGITANKVQEAEDKNIQDPKPVAAKPNFFLDLVRDDHNRSDIGDFQMLVVTFMAVGVYFALAVHFLGSLELAKTVKLPDVDTTILATFGLGQGAYLTKKAVGKVAES